MRVTDVVVWGLRTNTHSHHYIHRGVFTCFAALAGRAGVRVHWYDDLPLRRPIRRPNRRRRNYLIFASPHYDADRHVPLVDDARYILHADWSRSWTSKRTIDQYGGHADSGRAVYWRVFRGFPPPGDGFEPLAADELTFFNPSQRRLLMPWATDLLPRQVNTSIQYVERRFRACTLFPGNRVLFVGSVWARNEAVMRRFGAACRRHGLDFAVERIDGMDELIAATRESYMAPAIQGEGHRKNVHEFYLPCRILKNISYGALGVTNNPGVHDLFGKRLIYAEDEDLLLGRYAARVARFGQSALEDMIDLMELVRERHTYVNRLTHCLRQLN